jgi:hypothetical protein
MRLLTTQAITSGMSAAVYDGVVDAINSNAVNKYVKWRAARDVVRTLMGTLTSYRALPDEVVAVNDPRLPDREARAARNSVMGTLDILLRSPALGPKFVDFSGPAPAGDGGQEKPARRSRRRSRRSRTNCQPQIA